MLVGKMPKTVSDTAMKNHNTHTRLQTRTQVSVAPEIHPEAVKHENIKKTVPGYPSRYCSNLDGILMWRPNLERTIGAFAGAVVTSGGGPAMGRSTRAAACSVTAGVSAAMTSSDGKNAALRRSIETAL